MAGTIPSGSLASRRRFGSSLRPRWSLDGEVAIYDQRFVSRFEWMRHHAPPELATPPLFMALDCLRIERKDLRPNPLYVRRNSLEELLYKQDQVLPVRRLADDGFKAWQQVLEGGWEAYVAKGPQSSYVGGRTLKWPKVKQRDYRTRLAAGC